jgi:hypothetical protein
MTTPPLHTVLIHARDPRRSRGGLKFGATHRADGYSFANAKDPDRNSVSISSRAFRPRAAIVAGGRP